MIGGVTRPGGSTGLADRVTLSAGVKICHVNVSRWGNPPGRGHVTSFARNSNHNNMAAQGKRKALVLSENEKQATTSSTTSKKSTKQGLDIWASGTCFEVHKKNFELLSEIWGGSPATMSLSFGIDADLLGTDKSLEMDVESPEGIYFSLALLNFFN